MRLLNLPKIWSDLRSSLWFTPAAITMSFLALSLFLIQLDHRHGHWIIANWPKAFTSSNIGAQSILTIIATSMMTVAGVVFSITIVALTMAASQYSPRILRTFMRDQGNQTVLGVFVGVFLYCIMVLRSVGFDAVLFAAPLSLLGGIFCAFIGIGFLIYFIHHIATVIQVAHVIATTAEETIMTIQERDPFYVSDGQEDEKNVAQDPVGEGNQNVFTIYAMQNGYLQRLEISILRHIASEHDIVIKIPFRIGDFIIKGKALCSVHSSKQVDENVIEEEVLSKISISRDRTIDQDVSFGIRLIVDIALRALSPGINDTTTAVMAINYLTAILDTQIVEAKKHQGDKCSMGRVEVEQMELPHYIGIAFNEIRQSAENNITISLNLMKAFLSLAKVNRRAEVHRALERQTDLVFEASQKQSGSQPDDFDTIADLKKQFDAIEW